MQGANELLNNMFNIVQQQKAHALEVRPQHFEESLHNAFSRKNIIQEVSLRKIRVAIPEPVRTKRDEVPLSKDQVKIKKHKTHPHSLGGD